MFAGVLAALAVGAPSSILTLTTAGCSSANAPHETVETTSPALYSCNHACVPPLTCDVHDGLCQAPPAPACGSAAGVACCSTGTQCASGLTCTSQVCEHAFAVGYDQAWFGYYGVDLLKSNYNHEYVDQTLQGIQQGGGSLVRVWLFEGQQELVLNKWAPQTLGIEPSVMSNLQDLLDVARSHRLRVYFTLFDGNAMKNDNTAVGNYWYNLLTNRYGETDAFNRNALAPLLSLLDKNSDAVFGLDLMNEIQACLGDFWGTWESSHHWTGPTVSFIHQHSSWLNVTMDSRSHDDLMAGKYDNLGFNFYDYHSYGDQGDPGNIADLCNLAHQKNMPFVLGEYGQDGSSPYSDQTQVSATELFLSYAYDSGCFSAALAWRY